MGNSPPPPPMHKHRPVQSPLPGETAILGTIHLTVPIGGLVWFCADVRKGVVVGGGWGVGIGLPRAQSTLGQYPDQ